jgi:hypothetical protein
MVPMLPCRDIDEMADFWTSLGLAVTYRQIRPNPYLALRRKAIELHYYGMDDVDPELSHSTCAIVVSDTTFRRRRWPSGRVHGRTWPSCGSASMTPQAPSRRSAR